MNGLKDLSTLTAISPIDGRYRNATEILSPYFSEFALIKYRILVEVEYFIALCRIPLPQLKTIDDSIIDYLRTVYKDFTIADARRIKELEVITNHDVKAAEYFLKGVFESHGLSKYKEFIHFGLTSQDINNTAIPYALNECMVNVVSPSIENLISRCEALVSEWDTVPMLAHTHGQPASPTRLGKEFMVFVERLQHQFKTLKTIPASGKFGGSTGNFNAHHAAYPDIEWGKFADRFLTESLGLTRQQFTTQIEHYDDLAALCDNMKRINTVFIDLCRDMWSYISMNYFKQKINKDETGSSVMPHKVNPIDFENAEGNLGMANAVFEHLSSKLPQSRLQRDLTDSTVIRNLGIPFAHSLIAYRSISKGLGKLVLNDAVIDADLEKNWVVVSEAIQTILRRENYPTPYEALKNLTRTNDIITKETIHSFIDGLSVTQQIKEELKKITPQNYTGI